VRWAFSFTAAKIAYPYSNKMNLALFDLDNTLLAGDSDHAWASWLGSVGLIDHAAYEQKNNTFYGQYKQGTLDIQAYLRFALSTFAGRAVSEIDSWHDRFMLERVNAMMLPKARDLLALHAADTCVIVSATNEVVAAPIAKAFGVPHVIACQVEVVNGVYTGQPVGTPSFQAGKITRVNEWLAARGQTLASYGKVYFYSDSLNDLPLLEVVNQPVAVDPDDRLRELANERHWPIISLR
jgi:HAD superfamily hydrolase (TIGR01490 family)